MSGRIAAHPASRATANDRQYKPENPGSAANSHVVLFSSTGATFFANRYAGDDIATLDRWESVLTRRPFIGRRYQRGQSQAAVAFSLIAATTEATSTSPSECTVTLERRSTEVSGSALPS
jgi:hypothetical protein